MDRWRGAVAAAVAAFAAGWLSFPAPAPAMTDYPHSMETGVDCLNCHDIGGNEPSYLAPWTKHDPQDIDDTQFNVLCWSCHNDIVAPFARTHSSLSTSDKYGDADGDGEPGWSMECIDCHDPHFQSQLRTFGSSSYVFQGTVTAIDAASLTSSGAGWTDDQFEGLLLVPNVLEPRHNYRITGNTSDTLTTADPMDLTAAGVGDSFSILYGRTIRAEILTPATGYRETRFFRCNGPNSFADGDTQYNGICEVCHTLTEHFRNDGGGPDQDHTSIGAVVATNCCTCHTHSGGFAHAGGAGGTGCDSCHGHDDGFGGGSYYGTVESHSTHTEDDADDLMGPLLGCGDCHDTGAFPYFATGTDSDGDGRFDLSETDVCDSCHSPGGTYDGVDDAEIGARSNWDGGVYSGFGLIGGKEKWCASCHDESPATINGVDAPNVVGEESGSYTYGTGWGFYKTGHGLPSTESYPASGGVTAGAGVECDDCHDFFTSHVDGVARTFDDLDSQATDPSLYRQGYRLKLVGGLEPLHIPWPGGGGTPPNGIDRYRLCMECHGSGPFIDSGDMNTNFVSEGYDGIQNRHVQHLNGDINARYPSDWSGANSSRIICVSCHNVHGSTRLAMVRDGKLTGREPGQQIWYNNDVVVTYLTSNPDPPDPEDLPLSASTGIVYIPNSAGNLCTHCHANGNTIPEYRTPFQDVELAPTLAWTGETYYESDGVNPDSGPAGGTFIFRTAYSDANNDPPLIIQVWVDLNDDGDYDDTGEKSGMTAVLSEDQNYFDGKLYTASLSLEKRGDNILPYRFYASDGADATGPPTAGGTVTVVNNPPVLSWTGEAYYLSDGVHPDIGGNGEAFEFRITYTDADDEAPSPIQVWVDVNDDGDYGDAGEQQEMNLAAGGNGDFTDGETYTKILTLDHAGDGVLDYTFRASDGTDSATEESGPLSDSTVTVSLTANHPPSLDWVSADCLTEGVRPATGADGADFEFMIQYTDADNECPASGGGDIGVWIDEDDSGTYDPGEGYDLTEYDPADTDCTDGKFYGTVRQLFHAGDGDLSYTFVATDGVESAAGAPTLDRSVTVSTAAKVRPSGGAGWETSIQTAVNNNTGLILVYPNADFTQAVYPETFIMSKPDRTIRSVCGPDLTVIDGSSYSVKFQTSNNIEIDGFTLTGANRGLEVLSGSPVTVRNCIIHGNSANGIYAFNNASLAVSNCEIHSNGVSASQGGGIYINSGSHSILDSVIRNNNATVNGGGLFLQNAAGGITVEDTFVTDNTAPSGAGVNINNSNVTLRRSVIAGNSAVNDGGGLYQTGTPNVSLENCFLVDNEGSRGGGAYINDDETATLIVNTTVADNRALSGDGGAYYLNCAEITVRNSIFWNNTAAGNGHTVFKTGCGAATSVITGSDATTSTAWIYGGSWTFSANIDPAEDPIFIGGGDYHIQSWSPVIDQAESAYAPDDDIDGDPRPEGAGDDMGADEYVP